MSGLGHRIGDTVSVPGRGPRRVLVVLVVLVLAAAVGVATALSAPKLARAVGLPLNAATESAPAPGSPTPRLTAVGDDGPQPTPDGLARALDPQTGGLGTLTGVVIDPASRAALWSRDPGLPQTPASVTKLLTTSAALLSLDPGSHFTTSVVAGPTPDSVVLIGGGDPTLSSLPDGQESVYPGAAHLDDLAAAVRAARANAPPVRTVYVDTSRYAETGLAPGWDPADIAGGDETSIVPVMLDGGRLDPTAVDGARTATPTQDVGRELGRRLGGGAVTVRTGPAPAGAPTLGSVSSPPLTELVRTALVNSDNVLAEAIGREVARHAGAPTTFAGAAGAVTRTLTARGIAAGGVSLVDTSGLSTDDRVPAAALAGVLAVAAAPGDADPQTASLRPILDGLPVAGGGGTLADRYAPGTPSGDARGWVRAKTGTLTDANALAGTLVDRDGRVLVFALMSNGVDTTTARPRLDTLAAGLRDCGCR